MQEICRVGECVGCGTKFENGNRADVMVDLSNQEKMRVGVCLQCCPTILNDKPALWNAVLRGWDYEQSKRGWSDKQKEAYASMYVGVTIL